jgi:hypothetical protein
MDLMPNTSLSGVSLDARGLTSPSETFTCYSAPLLLHSCPWQFHPPIRQLAGQPALSLPPYRPCRFLPRRYRVHAYRGLREMSPYAASVQSFNRVSAIESLSIARTQP